MSYRPNERFSDTGAPGQSKSLTSYDRYKASLHAIFDGKAPLPKHLQHNETEEGPKPKLCTKSDKSTLRRRGKSVNATVKASHEALLKAIHEATTREEITESVNSLITEGYPLPKDEGLLSKALGHRNEEALIAVLRELKAVLTKNSPKKPRLIKQRIEDILLLTQDSEIRDLCSAIKAVL